MEQRYLLGCKSYLPPLKSIVKLVNPAIYDRLMERLITSLRFELFENIIHIELDSTFTNNETLCNIAIAMSLCLCDRAYCRSSKLG
jgi:hypothetical protein